MTAFPSRLSNTIRQPIVIFFVLGTAVFGLYGLFNDSSAYRQPDVILVAAADVQRLTSGFEATWRRVPSGAETEALVRDFVVEEAFVREALALGLDQNDAVIRQRLRQKMAFIAEAGGDADDPDDATLRTHFAAHPDRFASTPRIAFEQVFLGREPVSETAAMRDALTEGVDPAVLGVRTLLPPSVQLIPESVVTSIFGPDFFGLVAAQATGRWVGPLMSAHGAHLVRVTASEPAAAPDFEAVRDRVESDWRATRAQVRRDAFTAELLGRYRVERAGGEP